jgi:hypothetical protein
MSPISPAPNHRPTPREGQGIPPPPEWKSRDHIRNILPDRDPHPGIIKAGTGES